MENIRIESALRLVDRMSILDVIGEIDIYTTPQFKDAIKEAIDAGESAVIINMSQVTYMDSSGFGALLSATKRLRPLHRSLSLVACNDSINRMLQITRLNTIFGVYETEEDAIDDLKPNMGSSSMSAAEDCVAIAG